MKYSDIVKECLCIEENLTFKDNNEKDSVDSYLYRIGIQNPEFGKSVANDLKSNIKEYTKHFKISIHHILYYISCIEKGIYKYYLNRESLGVTFSEELGFNTIYVAYGFLTSGDVVHSISTKSAAEADACFKQTYSGVWVRNVLEFRVSCSFGGDEYEQ